MSDLSETPKTGFLMMWLIYEWLKKYFHENFLESKKHGQTRGQICYPRKTACLWDVNQVKTKTRFSHYTAHLKPQCVSKSKSSNLRLPSHINACESWRDICDGIIALVTHISPAVIAIYNSQGVAILYAKNSNNTLK